MSLSDVLLRGTSEPIRAVLEKSLEGRELDRDDALVLLGAQGRDLHFFRELVKQAVSEKLLAGTASRPEYRALVEDLKARRVDPYTAAEKLVGSLGFGP